MQILLFSRLRILGIIILSFLFEIAYSVDPEFKQLTPIDGLNNGTINDIAQDTYGQMWFATWDGLMRYDGYFIKNYKPEIGDSLSLPAKQCASLFFDSKENLWAVTMNSICRYDKSTDKFIPYKVEYQSKSFNSARIYETSGLLIIAFREMLFYLEVESIQTNDTFKRLPIYDQAGNPVTLPLRYMDIVNNALWISYRLDETDKSDVNKILVGRIENNRSFTCVIQDEFTIQGNVSAFAFNKENQVYIGTTEGVYTYDIFAGSTDFIPPTDKMNVTNLLISSDNKLWIGTKKSGLGFLDLHNGTFTICKHDPNKVNSILSNIIFSLFEDFSGNLWIGHGGEGLNILNLRQKPFQTFRHDPNNKYSLSTNTILCFNETENEVLIGTNYDGLITMKFNRKTEDYVFEKLAMPGHFIMHKDRHNSVWSIYKENDSLFWLGTNSGLIKATKNRERWKFEQYLAEGQIGSVRDIFIDKNKNMWLGCYNGLYLITSSNRRSMEYYYYGPSMDDPASLNDRTVINILLDKSGNFWIGTQSGGLNLLSKNYEELNLTGKNKPELSFIHYNANPKTNLSLNNNEINVLYEHQDGSIWIGTQGGGINVLDHKAKKIRYITIEEGLSGEDVFSLVPDGEGNLWISTNKGLSCYNLYEGNFNNYTPSDGIQGYVFMLNSYFRSSTGKLYFGGRNGFTCFEPSLIINNKIQPKVIFSGIKIFNKDVEIGDEVSGQVVLTSALSEMQSITLTHKEYIFSIRFSIIHFQDPKDNMAEYFLEGYDKNWNLIPASTGFVTFSNLPHGRYTLKLRGCNSDNTWSEELKELEIIILPPWWQTWWAKLMFFLILLSLIAGIMILILHRQSFQHLLKIEKIELENLKELNEEKLRFFTNISHELRTPLSLTIAPIENLILKQDFSRPFVLKQLNLAHRNAKFLIRLINQIIDFRRLNAGKLKLEPELMDISMLIQEVIKNFEVFQIEKKIILSLNLPDKPFFISCDPQKMEQIFYNLLSNAFKFTPYGGTIEITIQKTSIDFNHNGQNQWLEMIVYNEGKEIPENQLDKIFERFHKIDNKTEGSGIGLSYTKSLVELHEGKIIAESVRHKGVRFKVFFPVSDIQLNEYVKKSETLFAPDQELNLADDTMENRDSENSDDPKRELSILLVEDNNELRDFFKSYFENKYYVLEATNGQEGLTIAEESIPDIIICDIVMPVMNGLQLCESIKRHTKTCHIPVILLTAKDTMEYKVSGFEHGADAYVTKPFEIQVLDMQVKSLIRNRELMRENYRKRNFVIDVSSNDASKDDLFIVKVKGLIEENLDDPAFSVNHLSKTLFLSKTQVYRKIKALTGYSAVEFIRIIRLVKAAEMLKTSDLSVKEVSFRTGFNNSSYFIKCFREHFDVTPSVYSGKP